MIYKRFSAKILFAVHLGIAFGIRLLFDFLGGRPFAGIYDLSLRAMGGFFFFLIWFWREETLRKDRFVKRALASLFLFNIAMIGLACYDSEQIEIRTVLLLWGTALIWKGRSLFLPSAKPA